MPFAGHESEMCPLVSVNKLEVKFSKHKSAFVSSANPLGLKFDVANVKFYPKELNTLAAL